LWYPQVLANASHSSEYLAAQYKDFDGKGSEDKFLRKTLIEDGFGILDATDDEVEKIKTHKDGAAWAFADMISRRAQIGWSTHGHSGVDVGSSDIRACITFTNWLPSSGEHIWKQRNGEIEG
jgi:alkaline phosphatase